MHSAAAAGGRHLPADSNACAEMGTFTDRIVRRLYDYDNETGHASLFGRRWSSDGCRSIAKVKGGRSMKKLAFSATVGAAVALATFVVPALAESDADLIKNAETAAPAAVSSGATIYAPQADGSMKTLREGNNGFWCMPNDP